MQSVLSFFRQNRSFNTSDLAYSYTAWSVCCLSHSCPLLKAFHGFRCHLADTPMASDDTLC